MIPVTQMLSSVVHIKESKIIGFHPNNVYHKNIDTNNKALNYNIDHAKTQRILYSI